MKKKRIVPIKKQAKAVLDKRAGSAKQLTTPIVTNISFSSTIKNVRKVESELLKMKRRLHLTEEDFYRLSVAVNEAVMNAIIHGNKRNIRKKVFVRLELLPGMLTIYVRDQGTGFDPDKVPNPLANENLLKDSGRGVYLIRQLMDRAHIESGPRGTTIEMILIEK